MARPRRTPANAARMPGWTVPDAPVEIRRLAAAQAKGNGLNLHEFIARAVLCALDHGDFMSEKYDPTSMPLKSSMNDKTEKMDIAAVLDRLARLEAQIFAPSPPAGAAPANRANPPPAVINVPPEPGQVSPPLPLPVPVVDRPAGSLTTEERRRWFKPPKYARLSPAGQAEIHARHAAGVGIDQIAAAFGMSPDGVRRVLRPAAGGDHPPGDAPESP